MSGLRKTKRIFVVLLDGFFFKKIKIFKGKKWQKIYNMENNF